MINVGIIGCGKIAQTRHLPEYAANPNVNIAGLYDMNFARAQELADTYLCHVYQSVEEILSDPSIDAVSICAINNAHAELSIKALESGKHVLCEKPMATTLQDCENMVKAAEKAGKFLMIGQNQRLAPAHMKAKELISQGVIGKIVAFRTTFGHGGPETWSVDGGKGTWFFDKKKASMGAMADLGIHKIDLIRYLCGTDVSAVTARLFTVDKRYEDGSLISVDDNALCILELINGAVGTLSVSWTYYGKEDNSTILYGTDGIMSIYANPDHSIVINKPDGTKYMYDIDQIQTNSNQTKSGIIDAWIDCLLNNREPDISGKSVLGSMKAVFACVESGKNGKRIEVR